MTGPARPLNDRQYREYQRRQIEKLKLQVRRLDKLARSYPRWWRDDYTPDLDNMDG